MLLYNYLNIIIYYYYIYTLYILLKNTKIIAIDKINS